MSITGIASTSSSSQTNPYAQVKQDIQDLGKALQSGNLSDAQQAFNTLQQDSSASSQTQGGQNSSSSNQAMQNLGTALQSGDLSGAQQAFAQMQKGSKGHGHHHHQQSSQQSGASSSDANLTINIQEKTYSGQGTIGTPSSVTSGNSTAAQVSVSILS